MQEELYAVQASVSASSTPQAAWIESVNASPAETLKKAKLRHLLKS
jgi:hypothetical protein